MGIGTGLAFVAIGAILAFAFHFHVSGIDIQMIGWILIFVGIVMLLLTLLYTRPRRRRQVIPVTDGEPGAYMAQVEDAAVVEPPIVEQPVDPAQQPVRGRRNLPPQ
jgi:hypothetical protein